MFIELFEADREVFVFEFHQFIVLESLTVNLLAQLSDLDIHWYSNLNGCFVKPPLKLIWKGYYIPLYYVGVSSIQSLNSKRPGFAG